MPCDEGSRGFIVVAFCSAILHHWMCKIPTEVATLTSYVNWRDLKNKPGAAILGATAENEQFNYALKRKLSITWVNNAEAAFAMLMKERVEYAIAPKFTGIIEINKQYKNNITSLENKVADIGIYFAFARKSACLSMMPKFRLELENIMKSGEVIDIALRHLIVVRYKNDLFHLSADKPSLPSKSKGELESLSV
ncbi:hypothetical protein A0O36_02743 [Piscirickettsiaceae bacterium NZ-RLO1]|nr:hypothetical protein A0O36_02743 [Piscirickettsiaceae bacterium NZ-RLO1]